MCDVNVLIYANMNVIIDLKDIYCHQYKSKSTESILCIMYYIIIILYTDTIFSDFLCFIV